MQKRGRAVETQKLKRTMKSSRKTATLRESGTSCTLGYLWLVAFWFFFMTIDVYTGVRAELLCPFWTLLLSFYESMHRRSSLVHFTGQTTTFLFVCVTATSDLICYLFIPVRLLIFLATTFVWMNFVWHVNGGFQSTMKTLYGDKAQAVPAVFLWTYFVLFEIFCRMRCDYLLFLKYLPFSSWLEDADGCLHIQGMTGGMGQSFNALFSAHCIGYPLILVSFHIKYQLREWHLRVQQGDVSDTNEGLFRLLADSIPMDFDATRMYRRADYLDDECLDDDFLESTGGGSRGEVLSIEDKPLQERYANCSNLSSEHQLLLLMSAEERRSLLTPRELHKFEKLESRRAAKDTSSTTPVASPAENGVVQRRQHNGAARPSISGSKASARGGGANGKHAVVSSQQHPQQSSLTNHSTAVANGRRAEKADEGDDWPDSSSSEAEVALHKRRPAASSGLLIPDLIGRALLGVGRIFASLLLAVLPYVPLFRSLIASEDQEKGRTEQWLRASASSRQQPQLLADSCSVGGKSPSPHATPPSQLQQQHPKQRAAAAAAARTNGVPLESGAGGGRRRMANGDHSSHANGTAAAAAANGRASRSNGLGVGHDLELLRDVSRESARTQASEESGEQQQRYSSNGAAAGGGRQCGLECGKMASDCARLRAELRQVRQAEEAARLHATNCANGEKNAAAECGQLKGRIEQLVNKVSSVERQREQERATAAAAERKAAESAARAAELERELQKERVERREERVKGREKSETVSETQQLLREKEAAWEREGGRLRADARTKDEVIMEQQAELGKLRALAKSAVEAEDLRAELALLREKTAHLEENLAEENKLKQELFRALRNTQAERDRARQYDYSASSPSSFYPLSPSLGSPGSNGVLGGGGYSSSELGGGGGAPHHPAAPAASTGLSCAAEQAFVGAGGKQSYSFASTPATHTSSFLCSGTGQHTLFEPLPMPPAAGGAGAQKNLGFATLVGGEEAVGDESTEPFYAQNCGKFGAPSPASARTTTSS